MDFFLLWILVLENSSQYFKGPQSSSGFEQQEELCPLMGECSLLYNCPKPQVPIHFWQPYFTERLYFCRYEGKMRAEHSIRIPSEFLVSFGNKLLLTFFFGIPFLLWEFYVETKFSSPLSQESAVFVVFIIVFLKPFFKTVLWNTALKNKKYNLYIVSLFKSTEVSHFCLWASACFGGSIRYSKG